MLNLIKNRDKLASHTLPSLDCFMCEMRGDSCDKQKNCQTCRKLNIDWLCSTEPILKEKSIVTLEFKDIPEDIAVEILEKVKPLLEKSN